MVGPLCFLLCLSTAVTSSAIRVQDGVYTRVTVQIEDQPQPASCVDFLDHLEVRRVKITLSL